MRMIFWLPLTLVLLCTGCADIMRTHLADGRAGWVVRCAGLSGEWYECLARAGRKCKTSGYDTVYTDEAQGVMLIACKTAASTTPLTTLSPAASAK